MKIKEFAMKPDREKVLVYTMSMMVDEKRVEIGKAAEIVAYGLTYEGRVLPLIYKLEDGELRAVSTCRKVIEKTNKITIRKEIEKINNDKTVRL